MPGSFFGGLTMAGFGIGIAAQSTGNGAFNTGIDLSVSIIDSNGNYIDLGGEVLDFQHTYNRHEIKSEPISNGGEPDFRDIPGGGMLTITVQRYVGSLESEQAFIENLFHTQGGFKRYTVMRRVRNNNNGLIDIIQFQRCTFWLSDPGAFKVNDGVPIKLEMKFARAYDLSQNYSV